MTSFPTGPSAIALPDHGHDSREELSIPAAIAAPLVLTDSVMIGLHAIHSNLGRQVHSKTARPNNRKRGSPATSDTTP